MVLSGDDSAKKGTPLSLTEERYIIKESEIQLGSRYDQFISSNYVILSRLKVHKRFREPSRIPVKHRERTLNKPCLLRTYQCQENDVLSFMRSTDRYMHSTATNIMVKKRKNENSLRTPRLNVNRTAAQYWGLRKSKKMSRGTSLGNIPNATSYSLHSPEIFTTINATQLQFLKLLPCKAFRGKPDQF